MAFTDWLFGRHLATDEEGEQRVGVLAGIPMLGLDALGSSAYGPEAALTLLIPLGAAGLIYIGPISALITRVTLRGVRESGLAFAVPTSLFIGSLLAVLAIGTVKAALAGGRPEPVEAPPALPAAAAAATLWVLMRSFASGCTAMTGVE